MNDNNKETSPRVAWFYTVGLLVFLITYDFLIAYSTYSSDLPPLKWSSLRYCFVMEEDDDGKEETYGGRDRCEVAAG